ncbi:antibiotic acetyltransferase [Paenibacillus taichungensis]|uniref:Chloramphenicol acetyltransferase n=1 Tax=Paenibacillus taichungensis TaxID=484184 RepID=A0A329QC45_9BACL|nr:CatB-related O-acetyltransferase [Paenibacillus taichungensis]RAW09975.1 antibiotic acetyltransferase [Paenibacillus taichungensis]
MSESRFLEIISKISNLTEVLQNKNVIIFGAGNVGKEVSTVLRLFNKDHFFVDNNSALWGTRHLDIPIENPSRISEFNRGEFIVLVACTYSYDITYQLEDILLQHEVDFYLIYAGPGYRYPTKINGVEIGKHSYGFFKHCKPGTLLSRVGAFCSINETAEIGFINHPTKFITTHPFVYESRYGLIEDEDTQRLSEISKNKQIEIGNDVWIGAGVLILPSVKIGNGVIVGGGAVVTKDIPDYAVVVGVPAKIIKYRFSESEIKILNKIEWWNWSDKKIKQNGKYFLNNEEFFKRHVL